MTTVVNLLDFQYLESIYCIVARAKPYVSPDGQQTMFDLKSTLRERDDVRQWMHDNARDPFHFERIPSVENTWVGGIITTGANQGQKEDKWIGCILHCSDHDYTLLKLRF